MMHENLNLYNEERHTPADYRREGRRISSPLQGTPAWYQSSGIVGGMKTPITSRDGSGAPLSGRSFCG